MRHRCPTGLHLAREQDRDRRERKHKTDHRKGVTKSHDERLLPNRIAERDDGLVARWSPGPERRAA